MKKQISSIFLISVLLLISFYGIKYYDNNKNIDPNEIYDDSNISYIFLNGSEISVNGSGATIEENKIIIWTIGLYIISGTLDNGQIVVDTEDKGLISLMLNGTSITCLDNSPIYILNAENIEIILNAGTINYLADGETYLLENSSIDEPKAVIFSNDDLRIYGEGTLIIDANYNNGIQSDDDLYIDEGYFSINSKNHGLKGKDSVLITNVDINISADGDGIKSDNEEDNSKGYIIIEESLININSGDNGIQAEKDISITDCIVNISSGINNGIGIKAGNGVYITNGICNIISPDDAISSDNEFEINCGNLVIDAVDDAIHSETSLFINGGDIDIINCYEGLESEQIFINAGMIHINSRNDAINGVNNTIGSSTFQITGGYIYINSLGDGLDINGQITMSGGTILIDGPLAKDNGALDYDDFFQITGGFLIAAGSYGTNQAPSEISTQYSVMVNFPFILSAKTLFQIQTTEGEGIITFSPAKNYQSVVVCSSAFQLGQSYLVFIYGSSNGTITDGIYSNGTYTPGIELYSFTIEEGNMINNLGIGI